MKRHSLHLSILGTTVSWFVATTAFAAPINLTCTFTSGEGNGDTRVTLDESAGTAVFGDDPVTHANFTDTTVTWGEVDTTLNTPGAPVRQIHSFYSLNRDTGKLNLSSSWKDDDWDDNRPWATRAAVYHCALEHKLF